MMKTLSNTPMAKGLAGPASPRQGFVHSRMQNFGLTMIVMGASFILYYLGLFGGVSGPLQPAQIGNRLAGWGFSSHHLLALLVSFAAVAATWNWIYNGINRLMGRHMVCTFQGQDADSNCTAPIVKRINDNEGLKYQCEAGHHGTHAQLRIVRKGTVGHFMWMMWLVFSGIVFYHMI